MNERGYKVLEAYSHPLQSEVVYCKGQRLFINED